MLKRSSAVILLLLLGAIIASIYILMRNVMLDNLKSEESDVVDLVNGTISYDYAMKLEEMALNQTLSGFSFRSGGSSGAAKVAEWIETQFRSFGLETTKESFEFTNWSLQSKPELIIAHGETKLNISSFQAAHFSKPTPENGAPKDLAVLPLPEASDISEIGKNSINTTLWNSINTQEKIVLVGKEVRWNTIWEQTFKNKLTSQKPAAVIYTWWYAWMNFSPPSFSSVGGLPGGSLGPYYWDLDIPVGWVNYEDGMLIRTKENEMNVSAEVAIGSAVGFGPHYNVVAKIEGSLDPHKYIIVSAHYDSVMTSGFCDNAAGVGGVIECARVLSEAAEMGFYHPDYTVIFTAFASEELGLVGSTNYVSQHKAEMEDIIAVVNLDSIGSEELVISETPEDSIDLDLMAFQAASDINVKAGMISPGGSDQETFRNPSAIGFFYAAWGSNANISDATPVKSSTMLSSSPIFVRDKWSENGAGWIHTSFDNSTSTETLRWIEQDDLQDHIKVATLLALRLSSINSNSQNGFALDLPFLGLISVVGIVFLGAVLLLVRVGRQ